MSPNYDLDKIKFAIDGPTFERAVGLYEGGKVTKFKSFINGFSAVVIGTKPYQVFISARNYDRGNCECYLGERDILCKHMVAVAIRAVTGGKPLSEENRQSIRPAICSGRLSTLNKEKSAEIKKSITAAMRYIKPYRGPSHIWFAYQDSLQEGCNRLSAIVSELPVSKQTAQLLIDMLLRLDKKLCVGGVDDSDGTVGGFIGETVEVLEDYVKLDYTCIQAFYKLINRDICFEWKDPLIRLIDEQDID